MICPEKCSDDTEVRLRYFPPGVVSDATSDDPAHDVAYPRLAQLGWDDAGAPKLGTPYRLNPAADGDYSALPFTPATHPKLSPASANGAWQLVTPRSPYSDGGFVINGDSLRYDSGRDVTLLGPGKVTDGVLPLDAIASGYDSCSDGLGACFPLGQLVPAGKSAHIPDYYDVDDRPDVDRVWNGQTGELFVRATPRSEADFPRELQGEWCPIVGDADCFRLADVVAKNPTAFVDSVSPDVEIPGAESIRLCLGHDLGDSCTTAASMSFRYFPAGAEWDCAKADGGKPLFGFAACKPDYTEAHDVDQARLVPLLSHQHDSDYVDSVPLYRKE